MQPAMQPQPKEKKSDSIKCSGVVIHAEKKFKGISNTPITYDHFKRSVQVGCCICTSPIPLEEEIKKQTVVFYSDNDVVCYDCQSLPFVQAMFYNFHV
jgi:hypothetical protein